MQVKTGTVIRTLCLILALINQILSATGKPLLPIDDSQVETVVTETALVITALWSWWKNNSFTKNAIVADEYLKDLKEK